MQKNRLTYLLFFLFAIRYFLLVILGMGVQWVDYLLYALVVINARPQNFKQYLFFLIAAVAVAVMDTSAMRLVLIILICFMSSTVDIRKVAGVNLISGLLIIGGVLYLLQTGQVESRSYTASLGLEGERLRNDMGVGYNRFSLIVLSTLLNFYIYCYNRIKPLLLSVIIAGVSYYVFELTQSVTSFVGGLFFAIFSLLYSLRRFRRIVDRKGFLYLLPLAMLLLSVGMALVSPAIPQINTLFSQRPAYTLAYLRHISPAAFFVGNARAMHSSNFIVIDSTHIHLLFEGGIFFYIFFYTIYVRCIKQYLKEKRARGFSDGFIVPVVVTMLVVGMSEDVIISVALIQCAIFWVILFKYAHDYDLSKSKRYVLGNNTSIQ